MILIVIGMNWSVFLVWTGCLPCNCGGLLVELDGITRVSTFSQ